MTRPSPNRSVYLVSDEKQQESQGEKFGASILNSLVIVGVICAATFVLVLCYKFRCLKVRLVPRPSRCRCAWQQPC